MNTGFVWRIVISKSSADRFNYFLSIVHLHTGTARKQIPDARRWSQLFTNRVQRLWINIKAITITSHSSILLQRHRHCRIKHLCQESKTTSSMHSFLICGLEHSLRLGCLTVYWSQLEVWFLRLQMKTRGNVRIHAYSTESFGSKCETPYRLRLR